MTRLEELRNKLNKLKKEKSIKVEKLMIPIREYRWEINKKIKSVTEMIYVEEKRQGIR